MKTQTETVKTETVTVTEQPRFTPNFDYFDKQFEVAKALYCATDFVLTESGPIDETTEQALRRGMAQAWKHARFFIEEAMKHKKYWDDYIQEEHNEWFYSTDFRTPKERLEDQKEAEAYYAKL